MQRFSLLDYPGKLSAIVFTQGCNFRCPYCHNPGLVDPARFSESIPEEEVLDFLKKRVGKLNALTVTGGEPLLQPDLEDFLKAVKELGYLIKLDTNGSFPAQLKSIIDQGLTDYIAMDIKAPLDLYSLVVQVELDSSAIIESMDLIRSSSIPYEFRTTLFDKVLLSEDVERLKLMLKSGDVYYLQECRYQDTLEEFDNDSTHNPAIDLKVKLNELLNWGSKNRIHISLRTI
ncbi:MAG TPA: anaerobic ribonucleoside-triphosphate reductase activating protein [Candidatus Cloacimonadota bacterium]|nr:anaerobic ribonucleoside-triphosphate reductase activating protein [Candidatus Cloacimonadota bacterium]